MPINRVRDILGIFYLGTTALLGAYILLMRETIALPISEADATSSFQIILPTFIAQLSILFKWMVDPPPRTSPKTALPPWAVIGPPLIVLLILIGTITMIVWDQGERFSGGPMLKNSVTFCVSLLGGTSVIIIADVFGKRTSREISSKKERSRRDG